MSELAFLGLVDGLFSPRSVEVRSLKPPSGMPWLSALGDLNYYANPRWTGCKAYGRLPHPKSPAHDGHHVAIDIETGAVRWRHSTRTQSLVAALTTGGGLVVIADGDRYLYI